MKKKCAILVTGSSGFIGSHLVPALLQRGHHVISCRGERCEGEPLARWLPGDARPHEQEIREAMCSVDGVIHLAARNQVLRKDARDSGKAFREANVDGTRNVVRAAKEAGAKWFIHFSSVKAIGEGGEGLFDEKSLCHPKTQYGISKLGSEQVVTEAAKDSGLRVTIFRLPMVYGPRNRGSLTRMIRWADHGLPFPVFNPKNLRSMIYVGNVVHAVLLAIHGAPSGLSTYIVSDRRDYSVPELYAAICRALQKRPRFVRVPVLAVQVASFFSEDFRKVTSSFQVSSAKAERELKYGPPFSLEDGILETVRWYKSRFS